MQGGVILGCLGAKRGYTGWKGLSPVERYLMSTVCPAPALGTLPLLTPPQSLRARPWLPPDSSGTSKHLPLLQGDHAVEVGFMVGVWPARIPAPARPRHHSFTHSLGQMCVEHILS